MIAVPLLPTSLSDITDMTYKIYMCEYVYMEVCIYNSITISFDIIL